MELKLSIRLSENLYLRDPESTDLGRRIIKSGVEMIHRLGFEAFTFKKLGDEIKTTEASIYRYFENKHRLLLYIVAWYWNYLEYQVIFSINNIDDTEEKIKRVIDLLTHELDETLGTIDFDKKALYNIVVNESSKAYLLKDVDTYNTAMLFKPYKDLCARIATLFLEYNPDYKYPHSLASTVVEAAHFQHFFQEHLPRLTDFGTDKNPQAVKAFLEHIVFSAIKK